MIRSISVVILKGPPRGKLCHSDTFYAPTRFSDSFTTVRACLSTSGVDARARIVVLEGDLVAVMAAWKAEREELLDRVRQLEGMVADLEKLLGRNSSNSSSHHRAIRVGRSRTGRRTPTVRLAGRWAAGRPNNRARPGSHRRRSPILTRWSRIRRCGARACDRTLSDLDVVETTVRQVFDVPDPTVIVTEHRAEQRRFIPRSCTRSARTNGSVASSRYGRAGSRPRRVLSCKRNPG